MLLNFDLDADRALHCLMQEFSNWGPGTPMGPQGGARGNDRLKEKRKIKQKI